MLKKFSFKNIVLLGILSKIWSIISGPITVILIARYFSEKIQGYYYTFNNLLLLQIFIELGLGTVALHFSAHEWANLNLGRNRRIVGNKNSLSKLSSIVKTINNWFLVGGTILTIILFFGGYFYFNTDSAQNTNWMLPWFSLSILLFFLIQITPLWSILEGCNQLNELYLFKLIQAIIISIVTWGSIYLNFELWTPSIIILTTIITSLFFIWLRYWEFFKQLIFEKQVGPIISWKKEMFPMHWKIALSWISGYLSFSIITPILFKFQGPEIAGKFGMSWAIITSIGSFSQIWLNINTPIFSNLVSKKKFNKLIFEFKFTIIIVTLICSLILFSSLVFLEYYEKLQFELLDNFMNRLLPKNILFIFLFSHLIQLISTPFSIFMRSFKEEPILLVSIITSIILSSLIFISAKYYNLETLSLSFLIVMFLSLPIIIIIWFLFLKKKNIKIF